MNLASAMAKFLIFAETPEMDLNKSQLHILDAMRGHMDNLHRIKSAVVIVEYSDSENDDLSEFELDYCGGLNISLGLISRAKIVMEHDLVNKNYDRY